MRMWAADRRDLNRTMRICLPSPIWVTSQYRSQSRKRAGSWKIQRPVFRRIVPSADRDAYVVSAVVSRSRALRQMPAAATTTRTAYIACRDSQPMSFIALPNLPIHSGVSFKMVAAASIAAYLASSRADSAPPPPSQIRWVLNEVFHAFSRPHLYGKFGATTIGKYIVELRSNDTHGQSWRLESAKWELCFFSSQKILKNNDVIIYEISAAIYSNHAFRYTDYGKFSA